VLGPDSSKRAHRLRDQVLQEEVAACKWSGPNQRSGDGLAREEGGGESSGPTASTDAERVSRARRAKAPIIVYSTHCSWASLG
jgi:hypothetical protein